jgi:23S rRNA (adenine-N6)-dimethyltransferase
MEEYDMHKDERKLWQSQNFLKSPEYVGSLVDRTGIEKQDFVVEIGPGKGIITEQLSKRASRVAAIEVDEHLAKQLKEKFSKFSNVDIYQNNFLHWDLPRYPYKVFANIPFNMTADILNKLLFADNPPEAAYLILQDKAAGRFIGPPYRPMSQVSTLIRPFFDVGVLEKISKKQYYPEPAVNTVLTSFRKKIKPEVELDQRKLYNDFVVYGFNQWKPTFAEAMKGIYSNRQLDIMLRDYNLRDLKPSELNTEQWVGAFQTFLQYVPKDKQDLIRGAEKRLRNKQSSMQKQHRTR